VEHGHRAEEGLRGVGVLEAEAGHDDLDHGDEVPVRGHHALAGPRRAGGVEQRGLVVLRDAVMPARRVGLCVWVLCCVALCDSCVRRCVCSVALTSSVRLQAVLVSNFNPQLESVPRAEMGWKSQKLKPVSPIVALAPSLQYWRHAHSVDLETQREREIRSVCAARPLAAGWSHGRPAG
jgi:hypothetical protein